MKTMRLSSIAAMACAVSFSPAAHAQSSVTVFGVIDAGISHYRVSGGEHQTALSDHGNTSSRLGFRGVEDLGRGHRLEFWLEGGFEPSQPGTFSFARKSTIGISGSLGEIRLGRDYTPTYSMVTAFGGPWGTNGVGENLLYRARAVNHNASNAGQSTNVRSSNAVQYFLPKQFGGWYGQVMYGFDESDNGHAGRFVGGRLGYKVHQFDAAIAYSESAGGDSAPAAVPRDLTSFSLGASHRSDLGKISLLYINDRVAMPLADKKLRGLSLGYEVPVGPGDFRIGLGHMAFRYVGNNASADKLSLGYVYKLSKRTALYTTAAYLKNKKGGNFVVGGTAAGIPDHSSTGVDFGIRHSF